MKTSILNALIVTATLSAVSGIAQAAPHNQYHDEVQNTVSNTTRQTVLADYFKSRANGTLIQLGGQDTFARAPAVVNDSKPAKTRAQVINELQKAVVKQHPVGEV